MKKNENPGLSSSEETWYDILNETPQEQETPQGRMKKRDPDTSWHKSFMMYLHDFVFLLAIVIVLGTLCFRVVVVSGTSMNNTLLDGDYLLLISNTMYREPKPGDVIVASKSTHDNGAPIVKRVIATAGQTVDIDFENGIVYVDGNALEESYIKAPTTVFEGVTFPVVVEENCVFVLGDNRENSKDSRHPDIGQIDKREILGKAIFLFLPGTNGKDIYGMTRNQRDFGRMGVIS